MAYTRGNLAVREKTSERVHGAPKYRETTKVVTRRTQLPMREKLLYMLTVACVVAISGFLVWRNANIYEVKMQIHNAQKNTKAINSQITEYEVQKQKLLDLIPEKAAEYGYVTPEIDGIHVNEGNAASTEAAAEDVPSTAKK
ncbi:hypothetical protein [Paenibacillus caui]|uniref:hypothetical protein n=1 Tax=Paenibacillus caui TaxID=2873927 RepID=UPI001CA84A80|nr:hypothetical protein [Paenibacillus caui]